MRQFLLTLAVVLIPLPVWAQFGFSQVESKVEGEEQAEYHLGSACLIRPDIVLTCYHAVDGENWTVRFRKNGPSYTGKVIASDERSELALVKLNRRVIGERPISVGTVSLGEKVWIGGYGGDFKDWRQKSGFVTARGVTPFGGFGSKVNGVVARHGDSGGPVVDSHGYLVGIVWAYVDEEPVLDDEGNVQFDEEGNLIVQKLPVDQQHSIMTEIAGFVAQNLQHKSFDAIRDVEPYFYEKQKMVDQFRWKMRELQLEAFISENNLPVPARPEGW